MIGKTPDHVEREIARRLEPGERLLWSGSPPQGFMLTPMDILLIPFSLMWGGFAIVWEAGVLSSGAPWFFALWGIPFVILGLYIIAGRFFVDRLRRAHTAYALTDQRILILSGRHTTRAKSLALRTLAELTLDERGDGSGTITFGSGRWPAIVPPSWPATPTIPSFERIPHAGDVYARIRQAQSAR